jgi:diaminopimelate epimerase
MKIKYMSGAGNLFSIIDELPAGISEKDISALVPALCSKGKIKTEGLMYFKKSDSLDFEVLFYNPDGSTGMMCGNGGRCAIRYGNEKFFSGSKSNLEFKMAGNVYKGKALKELFELEMPPTLKIKTFVQVQIKDNIFICDFVNNGSDHLLVNIDENSFTGEDINEVDVLKWGKLLREHPFFEPNGTNANFYQKSADKIFLRTYERGVEKETGACGTGAVATAVAAKLKNLSGNKTKIIPSSGSPIEVEFVGEFPDKLENILLRGSAEYIGEEDIEI